MKKLLITLLIAFAWVTAYGQLDTINIGTAANNGTGESLRSAMMKVNDQIQAWNAALMYTLSAAELSTLNGVPATLTATELGYIDGVTSAIQTQLNAKQATLVSGTNIKTINGSTLLESGDMVIGSGGTMDYPGSGIALSTGSSWTTSITNNSTNWNTAYGWGDHSTYGYAPTANPTFTGTVTLPTTTSIGSVSSTELGYVNNVTSAIQTQFTGKVNVSDTSLMLTPYATSGEVALKANLASPTFTGTVIVPQPFTIGAISMTSTATELNVLDGIPGTLTSTELGYMDGVTSAVQTQINSRVSSDTLAYYSKLVSPTFTGTVTTAALNVGDTSLGIDSIGLVDSKIAFYDGADTLGVYIIASDIVDLSDYAVMLADSTGGSGHYASWDDMTDGLAAKVNSSDTASMLSHYALTSEVDDASIELDSITVSGTVATAWAGPDTASVYVPYADRTNAETIFPTITTAAGDTSNYNTPDKIGDIFIDTTNSKVYISKSASRGGWLILNMILPILFFIRRKRKQ